MNLFNNNPELKRNAWIELRPNRILVLPVLLLLLYIIAISSSSYNTGGSVRTVSIIVFHILVTIWGSKQTADAIASEINEKTWDRQRMTGLNPWKMVIGKLIGPVLFQWYGAAMVMAVYFSSCFSSYKPGNEVYVGLITIATGLFANAFALLISLLSITGNNYSSFSNTKVNTTLFFIVAIIVGYQINGAILLPGMGLSDFINWYGIGWGKPLSFLSIIVFLGWAIMGIYRNLRTELQYKNKSTAWNWFLLFIILYCFGFSINTNNNSFIDLAGSIHLTTSWLIFLKLNIVAYVLLSVLFFLILFEQKSLFDYKAFITDLKEKDFRKLNYSAPLWFITLIVTILFLAVLAVFSFFLPYKDSFDFISKSFSSSINTFIDNNPSAVFFLYFGTILLIIRDVLLTRYLVYCSNFKNKILATITYFVVVYLALPTLFNLNGINLFLPIPHHESILIPLISLLVQCGGAITFYKMNFDKIV